MTAVVTGATRGIGRATALRLAARGVSLALVGRDAGLLQETAESAGALGARALVVPCDLSEPPAVLRASARILEAVGAPSALVHAAGVVHRTSIVKMTDAQWDEQLDVNLRAPFLLTRALLPAMLETKQGRVVFVSSISATMGTARGAAYAASKWGLVGFMKSLAEELSGTGISTVAVLPGSVDTEMLEGSGFPPRMTADDVAKTLVHYALDAPPSHNGGVVEMFGT